MPQGNKTDLLVNMCKELDCNVYLSGEGALDYIDENSYNKMY